MTTGRLTFDDYVDDRGTKCPVVVWERGGSASVRVRSAIRVFPMVNRATSADAQKVVRKRFLAAPVPCDPVEGRRHIDSPQPSHVPPQHGLKKVPNAPVSSKERSLLDDLEPKRKIAAPASHPVELESQAGRRRKVSTLYDRRNGIPLRRAGDMPIRRVEEFPLFFVREKKEGPNVEDPSMGIVMRSSEPFRTPSAIQAEKKMREEEIGAVMALDHWSPSVQRRQRAGGGT